MQEAIGQPAATPERDDESSVELGRNRTPVEYLGLAARGFLMGCSDVVPGVSGGTMAFILGIYQELILSIRAVARPPFWRALTGLRIGEALKAVNAGFLIAVFAGIILAVLSLAQGLEWLLENQPELLWSFFFGLVVASVVVVSRRIRQWRPALVGALIASAILAFFVVGAVPVQTPESWWFLLLSGALAISAMILPGISGAFILVLLGKYQFVLNAVNERDLVSIALVGVGAVIGIVSMAQLLAWLFRRYHDLTVALLTGLMVGSLRKIWPWKETVETIIDRHGEVVPLVQINVLPASYDGTLLFAILLALIGFGAVLLLDRFADLPGE